MCDSVLALRLTNLVNLTQRFNWGAPPALGSFLRIQSAIEDLVVAYLSYASSVTMLLRVPVLARPQHSGSDFKTSCYIRRKLLLRTRLCTKHLNLIRLRLQKYFNTRRFLRSQAPPTLIKIFFPTPKNLRLGSSMHLGCGATHIVVSRKLCYTICLLPLRTLSFSFYGDRIPI